MAEENIDKDFENPEYPSGSAGNHLEPLGWVELLWIPRLFFALGELTAAVLGSEKTFQLSTQESTLEEMPELMTDLFNNAHLLMIDLEHYSDSLLKDILIIAQVAVEAFSSHQENIIVHLSDRPRRHFSKMTQKLETIDCQLDKIDRISRQFTKDLLQSTKRCFGFAFPSWCSKFFQPRRRLDKVQAKSTNLVSQQKNLKKFFVTIQTLVVKAEDSFNDAVDHIHSIYKFNFQTYVKVLYERSESLLQDVIKIHCISSIFLAVSRQILFQQLDFVKKFHIVDESVYKSFWTEAKLSKLYSDINIIVDDEHSTDVTQYNRIMSKIQKIFEDQQVAHDSSQVRLETSMNGPTPLNYFGLDNRQEDNHNTHIIGEAFIMDPETLSGQT